MDIKASKFRSLGLILASICVIRAAECSPMIFEPSSAMGMQLAMPFGAPIVMAPQAFEATQAQAAFQFPQFVLAPQFNPVAALEADRRSLSRQQRPASTRPNSNSNNKDRDKDSGDSDEHKALEDLPLSFLEPEPPSSLSERMSDTFSAIGEGVRNHFRSISENFSDTFDDIKDAWRFSSDDNGSPSSGGSSRKRG